ncbi:MAG: tRNA uridine-5-carboxymethylaminomethyl(34) synthesis enzyme MnmG [Prevotellaceae bacterium]|jgi:tRNA uridine 5-carboxymethylaminomethyl modification enzyme|nr:tRNA uridine-5-carboxymethylaminomethyl(34) synthesis enzyme MnmG [Prevotellaceae bacterium]
MVESFSFLQSNTDTTSFTYDIIVVGGGHAGCEAAAAAANLGSRILLITMDMAKFAQMSCNPAIGGIAKGQIVREIDAMGGYTGIVTDKSIMQFRMLNRSKGPAMWSPRAQCDRTLFSIEWRKVLESIPNLFFWQDVVTQLIVEGGKAVGVRTMLGIDYYAKAIILTAGTFLGGLIHVGRNQLQGGRLGELSSYGITEQLVGFGFEIGRMKTGTPARLDGRTINFSIMQEQKGDNPPAKFSFLPEIIPPVEQRSCYITYTSPQVHDVLRTGFDDSPLFTGAIKGIGPRYCPSIEDKLRTFVDKDRHQLFIEPEGFFTSEYYINGFSSSLSLDVQLRALRKVKGLENVEIFRPGYAIEYDFSQPTQLKATLETKLISGLYFAGQVNGTTGYEEAAAQGLMAGINAHLKINNKPDFILQRNQAYIGVLIDDLITKGVDEPYRMFTSRAEYRLLLRQDNADVRLTHLSYALGLASRERYDFVQRKKEIIDTLLKHIKSASVQPEDINVYLEDMGTSPISQTRKLIDLLVRPQVDIRGLVASFSKLQNYIYKLEIPVSDEILECVEVIAKYEGYIEREQELANKIQRLEDIKISQSFDYSALKSLSTEARQKLSKIRPVTVGQASRIAGVSPADISVLLVFIGR